MFSWKYSTDPATSSTGPATSSTGPATSSGRTSSRKSHHLLLLLVISLHAFQSFCQSPVWQLVKQGDLYYLQVTTQKEDPLLQSDSLKIFIGYHEIRPDQDLPSVLGKADKQANRLQFRPSFSFREGKHYTAFLGTEYRFEFDIPKQGARPELIAIYPSGPSIPSNLLKMYLHFSESMGEGQAYDLLTLTDEKGDTIDQAFVPLQPELWSEDRRRLTLWLDPGRIKRGLLSHETYGKVIQENQVYQLQIDSTWKDIHGNTLAKTYEKKFAVTSPDHQKPNISNWKIKAPAAGGKEPLVINFGESLDHALSLRHLVVNSPMDLLVKGTATSKDEESVWYFQPSENWTPGTYKVLINAGLEDLAGNNLVRLFDRDLSSEKKEDTSSRSFFEIRFEVQPAK